MSLSDDLISQFVKTTKDKETKKTETIAYGTIVERDGFMYVRLDGSKILTPVSSSEILRNTTAALKENDRVTVMVKNHTAVITGNLTSPSARIETVKEIQTDIMRVDTLISDKADIKDLEVESGRIDDLEADKVTVNNKLVATEADVDKLEAADVVIKEQLTANKASIDSLTANKADISDLDAATARIVDLEAKSLTVENADLKYANIDFTNIGKAAMEYFYAQSGLIDNVVVGDSTITGNLVGVTIKGDIIDGNTVVADKLEELVGSEARATTLGHIQRGGTPTAHDRVLSSRYGYAAVELAMKGEFGKMVALQGDKITSVSLEDVIGQQTKNVTPDHELVTLAKAMGVCFGD